MSFVPRKLTMQLTPLLDLLLIVIFAQYMEMRDDSAKAESESAIAESESAIALQQTAKKGAAVNEKLQAAKRDLQEMKKQRNRERTQARSDRKAMAAMRNRLSRQQAADHATIRQLESQRDLLSRNLAELFNVPDKTLRKVLTPLTADGTQRTKAEIEKIQQTFRQLARSRTHQIVRHMIKYEELLKRCDIWEIHFNSGTRLDVKVGMKTYDYRFQNPQRLELPQATDAATRRANREKIQRYKRKLAAETAEMLLTFFKGLPQPKKYVIILLSRQKNMATVTDYDAIKLGIREMAKSVRIDTEKKVIVLYADLGELRYDGSPAE